MDFGTGVGVATDSDVLDNLWCQISRPLEGLT
jgi:hypothetical protein